MSEASALELFIEPLTQRVVEELFSHGRLQLGLHAIPSDGTGAVQVFMTLTDTRSGAALVSNYAYLHLSKSHANPPDGAMRELTDVQLSVR